MYKHPMLSVKEAASLLGCDERWVRERLNQGQLKGEKKSIGLKEKWFVYKGEIDAALARKGVFPSAAQKQSSAEPRQSTEYFGVDSAVEEIEAVDTQVESIDTEPAGSASVAELVRLIANEFAEKLDQQTQLNWQLRRELEDKERQLRLLPDLQKQAEEERQAAELKTLETIALQKQIAEMETEKEQLEAKANEASMLSNDLELLKAKVEQLQQPWWKKWFVPVPQTSVIK